MGLKQTNMDIHFSLMELSGPNPQNWSFSNLTSSPYLSSGTPKATASAISGWETRTASTSIGDIFSPEIIRWENDYQ